MNSEAVIRLGGPVGSVRYRPATGRGRRMARLMAMSGRHEGVVGGDDAATSRRRRRTMTLVDIAWCRPASGPVGAVEGVARDRQDDALGELRRPGPAPSG